MIDNLPVVLNAFAWCILTSLSIDEMLLLRYANWFTNFRGLPLKVEMAPYLECKNLHVEANTSSYLLQVMQLGFSLG